MRIENVGLININMRLKLYYNEDCGIKISSEENKGTTVRVIFPKKLPNAEISI